MASRHDIAIYTAGVAGPIDRVRRSLKGSLDRRYANHDQITELKAEVEAMASAMKAILDELDRVTGGISQLAEHVDRVEEQTNNVRRLLADVDASIKSSDMSDRIAEAHRLANESAQAIEEILQQELLIRRDLSALQSSD